MAFRLVLLLLALVALTPSASAFTRDVVMVPVIIDGEPVRLEVKTFVPAGDSPFPTLIFHHGSTGTGTDKFRFRATFESPAFTDFFINRGWALAMPSRRGRGASEGLYDEGFAPDRSGYTSEKTIALAGAERALRDIDAVTPAILAMPFVDKSRVVIGGASRGGILSIAYAGQNPGIFKGVVNFVGGWLGYPTRYPSTPSINEQLFKRGASFPGQTLWLYGDKDPFYPLSHSRENFGAFQAAGGQGEFHEYPPLQYRTGHEIHAQPGIWGPAVDDYLKRIGLGR